MALNVAILMDRTALVNKPTELGFNYRISNLRAAIGVAQMQKIDYFIGFRRRNGHLYNELLRCVPGITLPPERTCAKNVYWMYSILIDDESNM